MKENTEQRQQSNGEVLSLFSSPVFVTSFEKNFSNTSEVIDQIVYFLKKQETTSSSTIHMRKGDQLHLLDEMSDFCKGILELGESICQFNQLVYDELYITSMWANFSTSETYSHVQHIHPNSYLSGIIHLKGPENCAGTTFIDPRSVTQVLEPDYQNPTSFNINRYTVPFQSGNVLIFPSWLPHCVYQSEMPFKNDDVRITLSFNLMFRGKISKTSAPLELK